MSNVIEILQRNAERIRGQHVLFVTPPPDPVLFDLVNASRVTVWSYDYSNHRRLEDAAKPSASAVDCQFSDHVTPEKPIDLAVIFLQKGNALNEYIVCETRKHLDAGGRAILVGETRAGVRSAKRWLEMWIGEVQFTDSARHCVLYESVLQDVILPTPQWETSYNIQVGDVNLTITSLPGVFSSGHLDEGTALLLENLPHKLEGTVLDFGCGNGVLAAVLKTKFPEAQVTLADANVFALKSAAKTFAENQIVYSQALASDVFFGIDGAFDAIISNPPFHHGHSTNYDVVRDFISGCAAHLNPRGKLLIVANRFLPYENHLIESLGNCVVKSQSSRFKILEAQKS